MRHVNILPDAIRSTVLAHNSYLQHETNYYTFAYFIKDLQRQTGKYDVNDQFRDLQLFMYTGLKLYITPEQTVIGLNDTAPQVKEYPLIDSIRFTFASDITYFDTIWKENIQNLSELLDSMADILASYMRLNLVSFSDLSGTIEIKAEDDINFVDELTSRLQQKLAALYPQLSFLVNKVPRIGLPVEIETDHNDLVSSFWSDNIISGKIKLLLFSDMTALFYHVNNGLLPSFHNAVNDQVLKKIDYITPESDFSLIQKTVEAGENDVMEKSLLEIRKFQLDEIITQVQNIKTEIQEQLTKDQYSQLTQLHGDLRNFATSFNEIVDRIYNEPHQNLAELEGLINYIRDHIRETEQWLDLILYQNSL